MTNISFHLFLQDQTEEDRINYELRQLKSSAKTFNNLNELWESLFTDAPNAIIVDIRRLNTETRSIRQHPLVENGTISLILFFRESDSPILKTLSPGDYFDAIKMTPTYGEIYHIHHRLKKIVHLEMKNNELSQDIDAQKVELEKVRNDLVKTRSNEILKTVGYLFTQRFFHQMRIQKNFLGALSQTIENFSFIENYMVFVIDEHKHRLRSYNLSDKAKMIPSIKVQDNLTTTYLKSHIQKTCQSITADNFGPKSVFISIEDCPGRVKYFVGLKVSSNYHKYVDSLFLSKVLSGELQRFSEATETSSIVAPVTNLFLVAERIKNNIDNRHILYQVSFREILEVASSTNTFYWSDFIKELTAGLLQAVGDQSKIYLNGVQSLFIVIDYQVEIKDILVYLDRFMVWTYFEDENSTVGKLIDLPLRRINLKSTPIEKVVYDQYEAQPNGMNREEREHVI